MSSGVGCDRGHRSDGDREREWAGTWGRPEHGPEREREHAHDATTTPSPWRVTTVSGARVTVLANAGAGDWNVACPDCGTYQGCVRLAGRGAIRGIETPCRACPGLLTAETAAVWPVRAGRDVSRRKLREAVKWGVFDALPTEQTSRPDPTVEGSARRTLLDGPNQRWMWFDRPVHELSADPASASVVATGVTVE